MLPARVRMLQVALPSLLCLPSCGVPATRYAAALERADKLGEQLKASREQTGALSRSLAQVEAELAQVRGRLSRERARPAPLPRPAPPQARVLDPEAIHHIVIEKDDPWMGAADPLVTLVVWQDFQCPYCAGHACVIRRVLEKNRRDVRVVFKNNPLAFHPRARPTAQAALAAYRQRGNRGFWAMHDLLFGLADCPKVLTNESIRKWIRSRASGGMDADGPPRLGEEAIARYVRTLRLDAARFARDRSSPTVEAWISRTQGAAVSLGARGTPATFVNGRYLRGLRNLSQLQAEVDAARKSALAFLKATGIPRRTLHAAMTATGAKTLVYQCPTPTP